MLATCPLLPVNAKRLSTFLLHEGFESTHFKNQSKENIMKLKFVTLIAASTMCAVFGSSVVFAQDVPDHPRVNEVNQRLDNQQARINQGVANGTMSEKQAAHDEAHDANIAKRESVDEAKNGGHLTKGEQNRLNRSLNKNSKRIYKQKH